MKVCHDLPGDMGVGAYPEIVTNSDIGGGGSKNCPFSGDVLFWMAPILVLINQFLPLYWFFTAMLKLLFILFIIKLYARNNVFKD